MCRDCAQRTANGAAKAGCLLNGGQVSTARYLFIDSNQLYVSSDKVSVLFIPAGDKTRASSRYRVYEIHEKLEKDSEIDSSVLPPSKRNVTNIGSLNKIILLMRMTILALLNDVVYIQKVPFQTWFISYLDSLSIVVFDFDDAIYDSPHWSSDRYINPIQFKKLLAESTAVVAGSPNLADYADSYSDKTYTLPTAIPKRLYQNIECGNNRDGLTLGWIGNPENIHYLIYNKKSITKLLDSNPNVNLYIITSKNVPRKPFSERDDVVYKEWSLSSEIELLSNTDVGIRPLVDDNWTRGKGGFTSVVQSMAVLRPVVVSPVGMLNQLIDHGKNGYFAQNSEEWDKYISKLAHNDQLRRQMGENARSTLESERLWTNQRVEDIKRIIISLS